MKFNFNKLFFGSNGKPIQDNGAELHLGEQLAVLLDRQRKSKHSLKLLGWGVKLNAKQDLELDTADVELLKKIVAEDEFAPAVFQGRIEELILETEKKK